MITTLLLWPLLAGCDDLVPQKGQAGLYLLFEPWVNTTGRSAGFLADGSGYVPEYAGLLRVDSDGGTSTVGHGGSGVWATSLSDGSVLALTSAGLQSSTDGTSWSLLSASGLPAAGLFSMVREPEPGLLVAAVPTSGVSASLYQSTDWGESWSELAALSPTNGIVDGLTATTTAAVPGLIQVNVSGLAWDGNAALGATASTDGGATWADVSYGRTTAQWETSEGIQLSYGFSTVQGGDVISTVWTEDWVTAGEDTTNWDIFNAAGLPSENAIFVGLDRDEHLVVNDGASGLYRTTHPLSLSDPGHDLIQLDRDCDDRVEPYKFSIDAQATVEITWDNASGEDLELWMLNDTDLSHGYLQALTDGETAVRTEYDTAKIIALDALGRCFGFWELKKDDSLTIDAP